MPLSFRPPLARPQRLTPFVFALASLKLMLPFFIPGPWEFHRDELLYLAMGDHLDQVMTELLSFARREPKLFTDWQDWKTDNI